MTETSSLTVAQLKEALKAKGLSTEGKKADLVARLSEALASKGELDDVDEEKVPEAEPETAAAEQDSKIAETQAGEKIVEESVNGEANGEANAQTEASVEASKETEKKPEKKVLTPEERKQMAVDLLTKKIKRAEKFGDEAAATAAKKDLARVEKFGVDPSTALAKEIGALDRDVNTELNTRKRRMQGKGKKAKGKKNKGDKNSKVGK